MTNVQDDSLRIELTGSWFELPAAGDDVESGVESLIAGFRPLDDEAERQLAGGLRIVSGLAHSLAPGARTSYALILDPASGRVQALLSIRLSRITPEAYDNYLAAAREFSGDERFETLNRAVEEVTLPAGPGILSHDFSLPIVRDGVPDPAMERWFLAVFPSGYEVAAEFTLLTQNLALFDDAGAYLMALAAGEKPLIPGWEVEA